LLAHRLCERCAGGDAVAKEQQSRAEAALVLAGNGFDGFDEGNSGAEERRELADELGDLVTMAEGKEAAGFRCWRLIGLNVADNQAAFAEEVAGLARVSAAMVPEMLSAASSLAL